MKTVLHILAATAILVSVFSCGSSRKAVNLRSVDVYVQPPVAEPVEITPASRAHTAEVTEAVTATSIADIRAHQAPESCPMPEEPEPQMSQMDSILAYAKTFIGTPYKWAANGPSAFDCSGFVKYVYNHFGYEMPRTSTSMSTKFPRVESWADLRPGDLIFFGERNNIRKVGHVGILVSVDEEHGSFFFIHASVNNGVEIQRYLNPYYMMRYIGAGRVIQ
ncbi:MAG: C40 family peptidase [Bacteroidales bacterium]|nr:C40 family peptidase [Bacteroidales bacterium]